MFHSFYGGRTGPRGPVGPKGDKVTITQTEDQVYLDITIKDNETGIEETQHCRVKGAPGEPFRTAAEIASSSSLGSEGAWIAPDDITILTDTEKERLNEGWGLIAQDTKKFYYWIKTSDNTGEWVSLDIATSGNDIHLDAGKALYIKNNAGADCKIINVEDVAVSGQTRIKIGTNTYGQGNYLDIGSNGIYTCINGSVININSVNAMTLDGSNSLSLKATNNIGIDIVNNDAIHLNGKTVIGSDTNQKNLYVKGTILTEDGNIYIQKKAAALCLGEPKALIDTVYGDRILFYDYKTLKDDGTGTLRAMMSVNYDTTNDRYEENIGAFNYNNHIFIGSNENTNSIFLRSSSGVLVTNNVRVGGAKNAATSGNICLPNGGFIYCEENTTNKTLRTLCGLSDNTYKFATAGIYSNIEIGTTGYTQHIYLNTVNAGRVHLNGGLNIGKCSECMDILFGKSGSSLSSTSKISLSYYGGTSSTNVNSFLQFYKDGNYKLLVAPETGYNDKVEIHIGESNDLQSITIGKASYSNNITTTMHTGLTVNGTTTLNTTVINGGLTCKATTFNGAVTCKGTLNVASATTLAATAIQNSLTITGTGDTNNALVVNNGKVTFNKGLIVNAGGDIGGILCKGDIDLQGNLILNGYKSASLSPTTTEQDMPLPQTFTATNCGEIWLLSLHTSTGSALYLLNAASTMIVATLLASSFTGTTVTIVSKGNFTLKYKSSSNVGVSNVTYRWTRIA